MRYAPIPSDLFVCNRERLAKLLLPNSLAVVNANDILPVNGDATMVMRPNSDLFYLTGVEQEETILVFFPDAKDEKLREVLFLRESTPLMETWEGHKLSKEEAQKVTGIQNVKWLHEFPRLFHGLMCECDHAYLNSNEHKRAIIVVETREARFVADTVQKYPLHDFKRLAPLMHRLRAVKTEQEVPLLRKACEITEQGFRRVLKFVKPGVTEYEVEACFAYEFTRRGGAFAYPPIIGTGRNALALHYLDNSATCKKGELLLLDVAASYANYNADLTRTIPVSGRFTRRQRQVYDAVLRVLRQAIRNLVPGKLHKDWQCETEALVERELVGLGLLTMREIKRQDPDNPAVKRYLMHGTGHSLGLDVHDLGFMTEPFEAGWFMTVEPAIYIKEEGFGVRLEDNILIGEHGNTNLLGNVPIEAEAIEDLMNR